jgi:hypothetical protein
VLRFVPGVDLFGSTPFSPATPVGPTTSFLLTPVFSPGTVFPTFSDPFGMEAFSPTRGKLDLDQHLQNVDRELMDMQVIPVLQSRDIVFRAQVVLRQKCHH